MSCSAELDAGFHTLTYTVTDAGGLSGSATRTFDVQHDHPVLTGEFSGPVLGSFLDTWGQSHTCEGQASLEMAELEEDPMMVLAGSLDCPIKSASVPLTADIAGIEVPGEALVDTPFGQALVETTISEADGSPSILIEWKVDNKFIEGSIFGNLQSEP